MGEVRNPRRRQIERRRHHDNHRSRQQKGSSSRKRLTEDCCVCYEVLVPPMVYLGSCPHRLHLPCYAALQVRAGTDLRCPACTATVTVGEADRSVSRQHRDEVMEETLAVARHEMAAEGGRGYPQGPQGARGENDSYAAFAMDWLRRLIACKCPARATYIAVAL